MIRPPIGWATGRDTLPHWNEWKSDGMDICGEEYWLNP